MRFWNPCLAWARIACRLAPTGSNKDLCQLRLSSSLSLGSHLKWCSYSGFVEMQESRELFRVCLSNQARSS